MRAISQYITQIDYIKLMIEDNRFGEALNILRNLSNDLETKCHEQADAISKADITFTRDQLKNKIGNYVHINNTWCKIISKSISELELEISKDISVVKKTNKPKVNNKNLTSI